MVRWCRKIRTDSSLFVYRRVLYAIIGRRSQRVNTLKSPDRSETRVNVVILAVRSVDCIDYSVLTFLI